MKSLHTSVEIYASPEKVWEALVASPDIPETIRNALHERNIGSKLNVRMGVGGRGATLTVQLLAIDQPREIRWKGYLWFPGLFDGEHTFEIHETTKGTVVFIQREMFGGLLLPFLSRMLSDTEREFEKMNAAIKKQAEGMG